MRLCAQMMGGEEEAPRGQWVPGNPHFRVEVQFSHPSMVILGEQGPKSSEKSC